MRTQGHGHKRPALRLAGAARSGAPWHQERSVRVVATVPATPLLRGTARCGASLGRECHQQSAKHERGRVCTTTTVRYRQAEQEDAEEGKANIIRGYGSQSDSINDQPVSSFLAADTKRVASVSSIAERDCSRASARLDPSNTAQRGSPSAKHQAPSTCSSTARFWVRECGEH